MTYIASCSLIKPVLTRLLAMSLIYYQMQPKYHSLSMWRKLNHKPWFGPQRNQARKKYHSAWNKYRRFRNDRNRIALQQSSKEYKKVMNYHINKHTFKNANKLRQMHSAKPKECWRYLNSNKTKSNAKIPPIQEFYNYYKNINTSEINATFDFAESEYDADNADIILNTKISEEEISTAINGLKLGKCPGHDEILNEHIKSSKFLFMPLYIKLLTQFLMLVFCPKSGLREKYDPSIKIKVISLTKKIIAQ